MEEAALSDARRFDSFAKGQAKVRRSVRFSSGLRGIARMALNQVGCRPMQEARRMLLAPIAWQLRDESIQINYHN